MLSKKGHPESSQDCQIMAGLTALLKSDFPGKHNWGSVIKIKPKALWVNLPTLGLHFKDAHDSYTLSIPHLPAGIL